MIWPRRSNRTPVLVLALLAGLVAMHGLSGAALASAAPGAMPVAMDMDAVLAAGHAAHTTQPAAPAPDGPHHGPAASAHHPCLAVPAAGVALDGPSDTAAPGPATPADAGAPAGTPSARTDRAPPDLNRLCISRT